MPSVVLIDDDHGPVDYYVQTLRRSDFESYGLTSGLIVESIGPSAVLPH
jgi:hypothetical protein